MVEFATVMDGLQFPECPRWRDGALWFTDMHGHTVYELHSDGAPRVAAVLRHDVPSGLGWTADGRLLVVAQESQRVYRQEPGGELVEHADLSALAVGSLNDMIVRSDGTAFVGDMGMRIHESGAERRAGAILRVDPDGTASVAAADLQAPNGMALNAAETVLVVGESAGMCLTSFAIGVAGELTGRATLAGLTPADPTVAYAPPDGICLDEEGAVWFADPIGRRVARVVPGGATTASFPLPAGLNAFACVLGGADRRTLFVCAAEGWTGPVVTDGRTGRILSCAVDVPGAGTP